MTVMSYQDILQEARRLPIQSQIKLTEDLLQDEPQTTIPESTRLPNLRPLLGFTEEELHAIAHAIVNPEHQEQMSELLETGRGQPLSPDDSARLDVLTEEVDRIALLKARALFTLQLKKQQPG